MAGNTWRRFLYRRLIFRRTTMGLGRNDNAMVASKADSGEHLPTCSGPENCAEYAAVLRMTPEQHANYISDSTARFAQIRTTQARQMCTSIQPPLTDDKAALVRSIEARLRRVSRGLMRITDVDIEKGTGRYEERVDGETVTSKFTFELDGDVVVLKTAETYAPLAAQRGARFQPDEDGPLTSREQQERTRETRLESDLALHFRSNDCATPRRLNVDVGRPELRRSWRYHRAIENPRQLRYNE
jgi:hypothetical protein